MSFLMRKLLLGSAALALAQLAQAQSTVITATPVAPSGDAAAASAPAPADQPQTSGASAAQGQSGTGTPVIVVPTQTETVSSNPAGDGSNDPYIQNRKAKAQTKADYQSRVQAAKSEYRQDKREARAANRAMPRPPLEGPLTLASGR